MYDLGIQKILINIIYPKNIGYRTREIYRVRVVVMLVAMQRSSRVEYQNSSRREDNTSVACLHLFPITPSRP